MIDSENIHIPVLHSEVKALLSPRPGQSYLDLTAGYGGHSMTMLNSVGSEGQVTLVDRDINAIKYLTRKFDGWQNVSLIHSDFKTASAKLVDAGKKYDLILADLGLSSPHLDNPDRGFSFMNDGPLDMRMDPDDPVTAADILNTYEEESIADILYNYADIRNSRSLAKQIIQSRPYSTTRQLYAVIPGPAKFRNSLAARVFQALRIVVNDELGQLSDSLELWLKLLNTNGKLAVITFHSIEDRMVKKFMSEHASAEYTSKLKLLTKKPIMPSEQEIVHNPRARSAKLRVAQRK